MTTSVIHHVPRPDRMRTRDAKSDTSVATVMSGRYIDRLERRDGEWKIALRRATVDLAFSADARLLQSRAFKGQAYPKSLRDERDLSYQRPLDLDEPPAEIW